ncbi:hypothetical protein PF003_g12512 [Phytophthora fragariae]|uniref:Uncharacterized protein n=1 Tax=Phytophthora fragariae TaxID=53985 RepID=A0A6A3FV09_9STRA|nr:hypothetical protein PF003_g12512 [Phytophthora fragariae]KAE8948733.1 hypothetical protein PF009_g1691 [Phytophthora fragariae]
MAARRKTRQETMEFRERLEGVRHEDRTLVGSGKKRLVQRKTTLDESWSPGDVTEENDDDDKDDEAWEGEDELAAPQTALTTKAAKASGEPKPADKSKPARTPKTVARTPETNARVASKKPRKKNSRTLAKEAREALEAATRAAAAKRRQDQALENQREGKKSKIAARQRLIEARKKKGKANPNKRPAGSEAAASSPKRRHASLHVAGASGNAESSSLDSQGIYPSIALMLNQRRVSRRKDIPRAPGGTFSVAESDEDALNLACDEDEEEMTFEEVPADDDHEVPAEISMDGEPGENVVGGYITPSTGEGVAPSADGTADTWPDLSQDDMLEFAKDETKRVVY